ncbi:MAG: DAK2 domain-containing protein, partial [Bacteroidales bacterium]
MQQIKRIDGKNFYYMFLAGSKNLLLNYAYLNKINVFPVPDGDTGTNMSSTIQSIIDQVKPVKKLNKTLEDMVDAALDGARGNSGLIVAQFVQGLYNELQNEAKVDAPTFAQAVSKAVDHTYSALVHPKEGTILTLFRKWSEVLLKLAYETDDFISLVQSSYRELEKALCDTKNQLSALTKAGVVDAGAQGFVFFVKGMLDFILAGGDLKDLVGTRQKILISEEEMDIPQDQITYRFCTEALITGINIEREKIREHLGPMGDSLVLAGNSNKLRVHIHTDTPQMVVKYLSEFAVVQNAKVDDMVFQTEIRDHRKSDVAILVDSSADIPD